MDQKMENDELSIRSSTGYWVTRLARAMERDFEKCLEPLGITRGAFAVLSAIHNEKKSRPAELAAFLGVDGAAVTRHLDRIEKKGLIERVPSATDRRATDIHLTDDGRQIVEQGRACSKATNERFMASLSTTEVDQLQSMIQKILAESDIAATDI